MMAVWYYPMADHHQKTNQQNYVVTFNFHSAKIENEFNTPILFISISIKKRLAQSEPTVFVNEFTCCL
ncbi:MAG: hypothetical protein FD181_1713 [Prolixibacteraceae bacterium]|nr:MAG: hypothetical protein FD181_1713 [Prolixibacteraceae bacterium]